MRPKSFVIIFKIKVGRKMSWVEKIEKLTIGRREGGTIILDSRVITLFIS